MPKYRVSGYMYAELDNFIEEVVTAENEDDAREIAIENTEFLRDGQFTSADLEVELVQEGESNGTSDD